MGSPFPGIDPFIEGQLWSDFHTDFLGVLRHDLVPKLRPTYAALIEERVYVEQSSEQPTSPVVPDVSIWKEPSPPAAAAQLTVAAPLHIPIKMPDETVRERFLAIRVAGTRKLVTVIEVLSPANKRAPGREKYISKRDTVLLSTVHLVEIDLLRGGTRLPMAGKLPAAAGYVVISDARHRPMADVWPLSLRDPLPTIPVPLMSDAAVAVNLQALFNAVYDGAGYDYVLDYRRKLEPNVDAADKAWIHSLLTAGDSA